MPQASESLRAEWQDDETAIAYLRGQGYTLRRDWSWRPPSTTAAVTDKEARAIVYLIDEWDFDGVLSDEQWGELRHR